MIRVEIEGVEFQKELPEVCVFCGKIGRHWHKETNTPMCKSCSDSRDVSEIGRAKNPIKTISRW